MKAERARKQRGKLLGMCLLILLLAGIYATTISQPSYDQKTQPTQIYAGPLRYFESSGVPAGISWSGDGQKIINPSFETESFSPWIQMQNNAASGSASSIAALGHDGTKSANLTVFSGNLTLNSYESLHNDLSEQHVGFSSSLRFRAAVLVQQLTGTTFSDRVEVNLNLATSTGPTRVIHYVFTYGSNLPSNTTAEAYFRVGSASLGQWMMIDRNVPVDANAAFPADYSSIDAVTSITLIVSAQSLSGPPNRDPHIKYWDVNNNSRWDNGEAVVYDTNQNAVYNTGEPSIGGCTDAGGDPIICPYVVPDGTPILVDSKIKFVDTNNDGLWISGEPIVYDINNDGFYDYYDRLIIGPTPPIDALLLKILHSRSSALFDQIELYPASAGAEWIRNGGYETGLTGWGASSGFTSSSSTVLSGSQSARGSVTGAAAILGQSIDARPLIENSTSFKASAYVAAMTGSSAADMVDVWLGLVDSQYNPVSLYFVFKTGDGSVPNNRTDAIYLKASGFGTLNQWLSINTNLLDETKALDLLGYTPPYSVEVIVAEVAAQSPASTTTAYFDAFSLLTSYHAGSASAYFYARDGGNTTYVYTAHNIPQGSLHLEIPRGQAILNVTSPEGTLLQSGEYTTRLLSSCTVNPCLPSPRAVDIPGSAFFKHAPVGDWTIFATSTNAVVNAYAEDPSTHNQASSIDVGSTVNLVSQSRDPFGAALSGVSVNLTLWNIDSTAESGFWTGSTNSLGWLNASSVSLPLSGSPPGVYLLQATVSSLYAGVKAFLISVRYIVTVSIELSAAQISVGSGVIISGEVTRTSTSTPVSGVNVTLSIRQAGSSQWMVIGMVVTDSSGMYSYTWMPSQGDYEVRANTGDRQTAPAESIRVQLSVGAPSFLQGPWLILGVLAAVAVLGAFGFRTYRRSRNALNPPRA